VAVSHDYSNEASVFTTVRRQKFSGNCSTETVNEIFLNQSGAWDLIREEEIY